jgi:hypothetical protein
MIQHVLDAHNSINAIVRAPGRPLLEAYMLADGTVVTRELRYPRPSVLSFHTDNSYGPFPQRGPIQ